MKVCSKCGSYKPWSGFYKNTRYADGYQGVCRECQNKRMRELELSGVRDEVVKRYRKSNKGRAVKVKNQAKYAASNPEKCKAHGIVSRAIKAGQLTRGQCEVCNAENAHAHHDDYTKPLDVKWLCHKHHVEYHQQQILVGG